MSLKFLEDWLLFMGGLIDATGQDVRDPWRRPKPIKLATYDTRFVESVCQSIRNKTGLTDRQVLLAVKVIQKYKRQWTQIGLDPSYLESEDIPLQLPIREVDRTCSAWIEDKKIFIKFPYDPKVITKFNSASSEMPGHWVWDSSKKQWSLDLLECNIAELVKMKIFNSPEWNIDDKLRGLLDLAGSFDLYSKTYPLLDLTDNGLEMLNCADSLIESMYQHGFDPQGDVLRMGLLAFKHGMRVTNHVLTHFDIMDPRRMLLESQFPSDDSYPGQSNMTWQKFNELMLTANDLNYVFVYRVNNMPKVIQKTHDYHACTKEYITVRSGQITEMSEKAKQSVLVTDVLIGNPTALELAQKHLAVLYMIADDERVDA